MTYVRFASCFNFEKNIFSNTQLFQPYAVQKPQSKKYSEQKPTGEDCQLQKKNQDNKKGFQVGIKTLQMVCKFGDSIWLQPCLNIGFKIINQENKTHQNIGNNQVWMSD